MSEAIWRALAEKTLCGRSGSGSTLAALTSQTIEGLRIDPLYGRSMVAASAALRQIEGPWSIAQRVDHPDVLEANRLALLDLEGGANALTLVFESDTARGFGLPFDEAALETALAGIELDYIGLRLDAGARALEAVRALARLTHARRLTSANLSIDVGFDPIGSFARTGREVTGDNRPEAIRTLLVETRESGFAGRLFLADGRAYHEAGAGESQELAAVLATALAYLRRLEQADMSLEDANESIAFLLVADADTFLSIAKFRALRRLWAHVERACGLKPKPLRLHAETAWRMMTRHDPWVNVMRATAAVFAAGVGGADSITTLPFTLALGLPEDGARRLARNTHLILLDESHLARVDDPAAGSGGLEALTDQLCARAWALFQDIEREGGIEASLGAGRLQTRIAETARRRARAFATLDHAMTGTSAYPVIDEPSQALAKADRRFLPPRGPLGLATARDAAPFEALRERADATTQTTGRRPVVFLATLGSPTGHGVRATYAASVFAAGGIATVLGAAGDLTSYDPQATPVVCVCAPDALYATRLADTVVKLRAVGAVQILLAGQPHAGAGQDLDGFVYRGCDVIRLLSGILDHPRET